MNRIAGGSLVLLALTGNALGATLASDNASDPAYDSGWTTGSNGGTGFGAWSLGAFDDNQDSGVNAGHFTYQSDTNGGENDTAAVGDIDTTPPADGRSWGLYANSGDLSQAVRPFTGALTTGQSFNIAMDNGWLDGNGSANDGIDGVIGFALQNAAGENLFEFYMVGGDSNYAVSAANVSGSTPGFTDQGLMLSFTLTDADSFSLSIDPLDAQGSSIVTGDLLTDPTDKAVAQVRLFNFNAGGGGERNAYFNSMQIIPEPASLALIALGGVAMLRRRRV